MHYFETKSKLLKLQLDRVKQEYWDNLKRAARYKLHEELKSEHIRVLTELLIKYDLFSSENPFEFPNEKIRKKFMTDFANLGHDNFGSRFCKCRREL